MNVMLTPELEQRVREKVERGEYATTDELVRAAVAQFLEQEEEDLLALRSQIQEGLDAVERGEYDEYDSDNADELVKEIHERGLRRLAQEKNQAG